MRIFFFLSPLHTVSLTLAFLLIYITVHYRGSIKCWNYVISNKKMKQILKSKRKIWLSGNKGKSNSKFLFLNLEVKKF